jgi:hypothetical protein
MNCWKPGWNVIKKRLGNLCTQASTSTFVNSFHVAWFPNKLPVSWAWLFSALNCWFRISYWLILLISGMLEGRLQPLTSGLKLHTEVVHAWIFSFSEDWYHKLQREHFTLHDCFESLFPSINSFDPPKSIACPINVWTSRVWKHSGQVHLLWSKMYSTSPSDKTILF